MWKLAWKTAVNLFWFFLSLYLLWVYFGWSASFQTTCQLDTMRTTKNNWCRYAGFAMLPDTINDAYGYTNFWIQYACYKYLGFGLYSYSDWFKLFFG